MSGPNFRTGADAAKEASKRSFSRTPYFRLKNGEVDIIRLLNSPDDGWITVQMHQMVPTKDKPANYSGDNWPDKMSAVCRNDQAFKGMYDDCYICDTYVANEKLKAPSARTWALALRREEVVTDDGTRVYLDRTREETVPAQEAKDDKPARSEKTETVKDIVILQFGYQNFFAAFDGFYAAYSSLTDRDYRVKRVGAGLDTVYQIVPLDPFEIEGLRFDTQHELFKADYESHGIDLAALVTDQSSDSYYARFFDHRITVSDSGDVSEGGEDSPKPSNDVGSEEKLQALADRVKGYAQSAAPTS